MTQQQPLYNYKIIVVGESYTGKTSIATRFVRNKYYTDFNSTIGVEFDSKIIQLPQYSIKLQIWDTTGQERFRSITKSYFRGCVGVLLVFDLTNRVSFERLESWLKDLRRECSAEEQNIILIGNKSDLTNQIKIADNEALALVKKYNLGGYYMTSAKCDNGNIYTAFSKLARNIQQTYPNPTMVQGITLTQQQSNNNSVKKRCSCKFW